ncbi:shikimate dehydrogenase [Nitratireductor sp. CH_MIT9313-5]|jgi:shikimate dehydrogenase|uniref:shikimate dehydrogenase n=1 Tax=Nitratireductor sp. CH_MIT9313-5 TaxID=3107764 RepID=UPI00300B5BFA
MAEAPIKAFVCGHPIKHSRSPLIHGYWLEKYELDGSYEAIDVAPEDFAHFLHTLHEQGYAGGNVTLPHKESAFKIVEKLDGAAEKIGAVNTIWLENGHLCGSNTDAYGFAANLDQQMAGWDSARTAVLLGAGGAARAVIHALQERGFDEIRIVNRTEARARDLQARFGGTTSAHSWEALDDLLASTDLLVNTTSLGMAGSAPLSISLDPLPDHAIVSDIVYVPLQTPLLADAQERGLRTVEGLGMLLHQAVAAFERWFGVKPEVTGELRQRIIDDLRSGK